MHEFLGFIANFEIFVVYFSKILPFLKKFSEILNLKRTNFYKILTFFVKYFPKFW